MYDGGFGGRVKLIPALLIFATMTVGFVAWGCSETAKGSWPTAQGKRGRLVGETWMEFNLLLGNSKETTTHVTYKYEVDGKSYTGSEGLGDNSWSRARFERLTSGPTVTVRYDPAKPSDSWLDDGEPRTWIWV